MVHRCDEVDLIDEDCPHCAQKDRDILRAYRSQFRFRTMRFYAAISGGSVGLDGLVVKWVAVEGWPLTIVLPGFEDVAFFITLQSHNRNEGEGLWCVCEASCGFTVAKAKGCVAAVLLAHKKLREVGRAKFDRGIEYVKSSGVKKGG